MDANEIIRKDIDAIIADLGDGVQRASGKTFLITGPAGLLAGYLVDTLAALNDRKILQAPCRVIGLQRSPIVPGSRLGHLLGRPDVEFAVHDVRTPYELREKVDFIVHAAGRSAPATFQEDPLGTIDVNVSGVRWLLEHARRNPVESFLYMSSGEIYGNPPPEFIPTPETFNGNVSTLAPRACYTESKRLAETLCRTYFEKFGVPAKIARPFIVYGPGMEVSDRRVMTDFIRQGMEGKPISMLTPGKDTRSYCYVTDGTVAFFRILFSDRDADPFNVASDLEEVSIRELAETVHRIFGITEPVGVPAASADPKFLQDAPLRVRPDITKLRQAFGFEPKVRLEEGLRRLVDWNLLRAGKEPLSP